MTTNKTKIFIDGQHGTTGLKIHERLKDRPDIELLELPLADRKDLAKVDVSGVRRAINIGLLEDGEIQPGDWVLIHVGFALSKIDEEEAGSKVHGAIR